MCSSTTVLCNDCSEFNNCIIVRGCRRSCSTCIPRQRDIPPGMPCVNIEHIFAAFRIHPAALDCNAEMLHVFAVRSVAVLCLSMHAAQLPRLIQQYATTYGIFMNHSHKVGIPAITLCFLTGGKEQLQYIYLCSHIVSYWNLICAVEKPLHY